MSNDTYWPSWKDPDWNNARGYDTIHPNFDERRRHEEECRNGAPTRRDQHDRVFHRSESSSSIGSLYANPPSPTLRPGLHPVTEERYTSLQNVPHFSLGYTSASSYRYGFSVVPKTPSPTLPQAEPLYYQRPPGLTHPLPEPLPQVLRVVNPDAPVPEDPHHSESSIPTSRPSTKLRLKKKKKRPESRQVEFTDLFARKDDEQKCDSLLQIKTALQEKQKARIGVKEVTRKLGPAFQNDKVQQSKDEEKAEKKASAEKNTDTFNRILEVLNTLVAKAEEEVKWDSVDLSDDEDWEKVASDEGADWEVIRK